MTNDDVLTNKQKWVAERVGNIITIVIGTLIIWSIAPPFLKTWWLG